MAHDVWAAGDAYQRYVGRWSRPVAEAFVRWLDLPAGGRWLDVGCGTGVLTATLPADEVVGVDPSGPFLQVARAAVPGAEFHQADARELPFPDRSFDAVVSGLALNFVPEPERAVAEFARVGSAAAAYVWDYAEGMAMMRHFWDAAAELDPAAAELDEGSRFGVCAPGPLTRLWTDAGLQHVEARSITVPTVFTDFDDYWTPFLGGTGPAPGYATSLAEDHRAELRDLLRSRLVRGPDGRISLTARAWAVRGEH